jgi:hypothetical protein
MVGHGRTSENRQLDPSWRLTVALNEIRTAMGRDRRTTCPARDEPEGNGLIFLIMVALKSTASASMAQGKNQVAVGHGRWR